MMGDDSETSRYVQLKHAEQVDRPSDGFIATLVSIGADDSFVRALKTPPQPRPWKDAIRAWRNASRARQSDAQWFIVLREILRAIVATIRALFSRPSR